MEDELFEVHLALVLTQAGVYWSSVEQDLGWKILCDFRDSYPGRRKQITAEMIRWAFLHCSPESVVPVLEWGKEALEPELYALYESALRMLNSRSVSSEERAKLQTATETDPVWHFPLGMDAWSQGNELTGVHHFERFCYFLRPDYRDPAGWMGLEARNLETFSRLCQVCELAPAEKQLTGRSSLVYACRACYELKRNEIKTELAGNRIDKGDVRVRHLARVCNPFDLDRLVSSGKAKEEASRPLKTRLAYRRVSTLERHLDEVCQELLRRADNLAKRAGLGQANSCALLVSFLDTEDFSDQSTEDVVSARLAALDALATDDPESLREVLNVALWYSIMGHNRTTVLRRDLEAALSLTSLGQSSTILMAHLPTAASFMQWIFLSHRTPEQAADVARLQKRFPFRFLRLANGMSHWFQPDGPTYLWFLQNESVYRPHFGPLKRRDKDAVEIIEAWRSRLISDQSAYALLRADECFLVHFPRVTRAIARLRMRRYSLEFAPNLPLHSGAHFESHDFAKDALAWLETHRHDLLGLSRNDLQVAANVAREAGFNEKAKLYAKELLEREWSPPLSDSELYYAHRTLLEMAYEEEDYPAAIEQLLLMPPVSPGSDGMVVMLTPPLWTAGYRDEFHAVLDRLKGLPEANVSYLEQMSQLYRNIEAHWSVDEVKAVAALRL